MSDKKEQVSALVDGENYRSNTLDDLVNDETLQTRWARYHVIRDTLKHEQCGALPVTFAKDVMSAISNDQGIDGVTDVSPKRRSIITAKITHFGRQFAQYGIAASVAVGMVVGVQQLNQTQSEQPFSTARVPVIPGVSGGMSPVSLDSTRAVESGENRLLTEQKRRLNTYLSEHRAQTKRRASNEPQVIEK